MLEHKCEICGKMNRKKLKADGRIVCTKHYTQFRKKGYFTDLSPRTQRDKNKITIDGDVACMELYDIHYNVIALVFLDAEDVDKVKNIKWRLNNQGYVYNNSNTGEFVHRRVLECNTYVDHINGNRLDNRKCNLRIATKSQNQMNVNYKGVQHYKNKYIAHIKLHQKMIYLGGYVYENEAVYARWFAEKLVFKDFAFPKPMPIVLEKRKEEIEEYVKQKVQRL